MQKGENMAEVVKFLYVIIIFLSLILVAVNLQGKLFYLSFLNFIIYFFT